MPYPSQTSAEQILQTTRDMIAQVGIEKLSMNKLARRLQIKAPSLYRYYNSKAALLRAVNEDTIQRLVLALKPALELEVSPFDKAMEMARLYRQFAHENASVYGMLFTNTMKGLNTDPQITLSKIAPYRELFGKVTNEQYALSALGGFIALLHGFVMLEFTHPIQPQHSQAHSYELTVRAYLEGWQHA